MLEEFIAGEAEDTPALIAGAQDLAASAEKSLREAKSLLCAGRGREPQTHGRTCAMYTSSTHAG